MAELEVHTEVSNSELPQIAFSPDGSRITSISYDATTVRVWDAADAGEPRGLGGDGPGRGERGDGGGPLGGAEGFADEAESGA